jgi:arylsulfatase A-like enzyme
MRHRRFFLYIGYNGPYGLDQDLRMGHQNRHTAYYADKELSCFPREEAHPWLRQNLDCIDNDVAVRSYAAAVSGVDDGVGRILETLTALHLDRSTLVIFTADHGLCAGHHGMWGMGDHSRPLHLFQENLRVPLVFRHPPRIPPGGTVETMACTYDFLPSVLSYLGLPHRLPDVPQRAGRSYAPALGGRELEWGEEITFHEYENTRAAQTPEWKLVRRHPDGPNELYDMRNDPEERMNLIDQPRSAGAQRELDERMQAFFGRYVDAQYDLWHGGVSKAGRILSEEA